MNWNIARAAIAMALSSYVGSAYSGDAAMPNLKDPTIIAAGEGLFHAKHCSTCHGSDGNGGVNLTRRDLSDPDLVFQAVAEGRERNGLRMPAWRGVLTDQEIWEAVAFVTSLTQPAK
jgi:mono/diheme cytochrome c family protein